MSTFRKLEEISRVDGYFKSTPNGPSQRNQLWWKVLVLGKDVLAIDLKIHGKVQPDVFHFLKLS